jgi:hypothetical protein
VPLQLCALCLHQALQRHLLLRPLAPVPRKTRPPQAPSITCNRRQPTGGRVRRCLRA